MQIRIKLCYLGLGYPYMCIDTGVVQYPPIITVLASLSSIVFLFCSECIIQIFIYFILLVEMPHLEGRIKLN